MSKLELAPLFERMANAEEPPETASLREERRKRVIGDMRSLHVRLVHERARGANVRRLSRIVLIAATLAVAGGAFASIGGYGPLARLHASGTGEATSACAPPERAPTSQTRTLTAAPADEPSIANPADTSSATTSSATTSSATTSSATTSSADAKSAAHVRAPETHTTGNLARRDEKSALEAINRLFSEAKRARREGRNADALVSLDQLLGRYPQSVLAQEASVERFRVLSKLGRAAEARRAAAAYLSHYPSGFAAGEAERLSGSADAP